MPLVLLMLTKRTKDFIHIIKEVNIENGMATKIM